MMNKVFTVAIWALGLSMLFASCSKSISPDTPLPNLRMEAVYITTDNSKLLSLNPLTGQKNWEISTQGTCDGMPVFHNRKIYLLTNQGYIYSVDVLTGKIHNQKQIFKTTRAAITAQDNRLYISGVDSMYCYDTTFNQIWAAESAGGSGITAPQVNNGRVYFSSGLNARAVDANSGTSVYSVGMPSPLNSSPRISNGLVYFGADDNKIYCLNAGDGSTKWSYTTNQQVVSSPVVYGGMCIVGSNDYHVYCIDTFSGNLRWKYPTQERVLSSPAIYAPTNSVLVGSNDFNLYSIDFVTGKVNWKYPAGSQIISSPLIYGDYAYFAAADKYLYCVHARFGYTVWKYYMATNTLSSAFADDLKNGVHATISGSSIY